MRRAPHTRRVPLRAGSEYFDTRADAPCCTAKCPDAKGGGAAFLWQPCALVKPCAGVHSDPAPGYLRRSPFRRHPQRGNVVPNNHDNIPLQGARLDHYGNMPVSECRANAEAARDRVFEFADQARDEVPDLLADENAFDSEVVQAANDEFEAINTICDCIADLLCDPEDLTRR